MADDSLATAFQSLSSAPAALCTVDSDALRNLLTVLPTPDVCTHHRASYARVSSVPFIQDRYKRGGHKRGGTCSEVMLMGILARSVRRCITRSYESAAAALASHSSTRFSAAECENILSKGTGVAIRDAMISSSADAPTDSEPASGST